MPPRRSKRQSSVDIKEEQDVSPVKRVYKKKPLEERNTNEFVAAKTKLHTSTIPDNLPCREKEFQEIYLFLQTHISNRTSGCMYISGVPGTGKTATVHEVVRALESEFKSEQEEEEEKKKKRKKKTDEDAKKRARKVKKKVNASMEHAFTFIEINALRLTEPKKFYVELYKKLVGDSKRISVSSAKDYMSNYFCEVEAQRQQERPFIVLMVDELDLLCTRKQQILYHLFNWPMSDVNLAVVAIANTMDLPERVMMSRISSRVGLNRITFQPYTHIELKQIIKSRIDSLNIFDGPAVELIARKVASVSGDARKALDLCRKAVLMAESSYHSNPNRDGLVNIDDVQAALRDLSSAVKASAIRQCSKHEQIFLEAVISAFEQNGLEEASFESVARIHENTSFFRGHKCSISQLFHIAFRLYEHRLILLDTSPGCFLSKKVRLNVSKDDIDLALKMQEAEEDS